MGKKESQRWMGKLREEPMSEQAPMYLYATEMVSTYYSLLKVRGKCVLTVCGSGDQVLDAFFLGAKRVVGFDLNKNSEFITQLKITAISLLDYKEYLDFLGGKNSQKRLDYNIYIKIRTCLDKKSRGFFDSLYSKSNFSSKRLLLSNRFRQRDDFAGSRIKQINQFLKDEKAYLKMRGIIKKIKFEFVHADIKGLDLHKDVQKERFDIINMSNVPTYIVGGLEKRGNKDSCGYFIEKITGNLFNLLNKGGFLFYYVYSPSIYPNKLTSERSSAANISSFKKFKSKISITEKLFEGVSKKTKDKIIILKQIK
jgi:hypothetical protein